MKIKLLFIISTILMIFSIVNISTTFSSDKALYYDAKEKKIIYYNTNPNDLFDEFKNIIPGDIKEQEIKIKIINANEDINMYLKLDYEENKDINDNIKIKIYKNNQEIIKNNELFKIIDNNDDVVTLKIVMEVPTSIGNEISNYNNAFRMTFFVENNEEIIEVPKTYENNIYIYFISLFVALFLLILTIKKYLKDKKETVY